MGKDLDDAWNTVFSIEGVPETQQKRAITGLPVTVSLSSMAQKALAHYTKAKVYLKEANWSKYGEELNQLEDILKKMTQQKKNASGKNPVTSGTRFVSHIIRRSRSSRLSST